MSTALAARPPSAADLEQTADQLANQPGDAYAKVRALALRLRILAAQRDALRDAGVPEPLFDFVGAVGSALMELDVVNRSGALSLIRRQDFSELVAQAMEAGLAAAEDFEVASKVQCRGCHKHFDRQVLAECHGLHCESCLPLAITRRNARVLKTALARARAERREATILATEWVATVHAFGDRCAYCHGPWTVIAFVEPLELGGAATASNCVPSCRRCLSNPKPSAEVVAWSAGWRVKQGAGR